MALNRKGCVLMVLVSLMLACSQPEETPANNQSMVGATLPPVEPQAAEPITPPAPEPYQLPKRPDTPDPVLTVADVKLMTTPEQFAQALVATDPQVRLAAVQALKPSAANLADAPLQRLINMLDAEQDKTIVKEVALLLSKTCHPAVMMMLFNNLKRDTYNINIEALAVLGDIAGYRAVEKIDELLERLADDQSSVAQQIQPVAQEAKSKIMARNGKPLMCSW